MIEARCRCGGLKFFNGSVVVQEREKALAWVVMTSRAEQMDRIEWMDVVFNNKVDLEDNLLAIKTRSIFLEADDSF